MDIGVLGCVQEVWQYRESYSVAWAYSLHFRPSAVTGLKQCAQGLSGFSIRSSGATHGWGKLSFSRVVLGFAIRTGSR